MYTIAELENIAHTNDEYKLISVLFGLDLLKKEFRCPGCTNYCNLNKYKKNTDCYGWRCQVRSCSKFKEYFSIRSGSFFEGFNSSLKNILLVLIKYASRQPIYSINSSSALGKRTISKIIKKIINMIPAPDFSNAKLGGPGSIVQVDETMLNYKCKSHRGRSPANRSDALSIVECRDSIIKCFATIIPDKKASTIIPILVDQIAHGSTIYTDEHRSYSQLSGLGYNHRSVCHKYEFINSTTGVNTQAIESFHNELKLAVKRRKGVITSARPVFLNEFVFYFNNKNRYLESLLNLIKC